MSNEIQKHSLSYRLTISYRLLKPYVLAAVVIVAVILVYVFIPPPKQEKKHKSTFVKPFIIIDKRPSWIPQCSDYIFQDGQGNTSEFTDSFNKFKVGDTL